MVLLGAYDCLEYLILPEAVLHRVIVEKRGLFKGEGASKRIVASLDLADIFHGAFLARKKFRHRGSRKELIFSIAFRLLLPCRNLFKESLKLRLVSLLIFRQNREKFVYLVILRIAIR